MRQIELALVCLLLGEMAFGLFSDLFLDHELRHVDEVFDRVLKRR